MQYDCLSCGACCYGPHEYVAVTAVDLCRMNRQTQSRFVVDVGPRKYMKMVHGHCAALHARQGHYSCRVYKMRPKACQIVEPGSRECLVARKKRGVDP